MNVDLNESVPANTRVVTAVLTVHNRAALTERCLDAFLKACAHAGVVGRAIVVDDGSSDETESMLAAFREWVQVIHGDGGLFWNRGMHRGLDELLNKSRNESELILWLNNDTFLKNDALVRLIDCESAMTRGQSGALAVVVGMTADPESGRVTYSGLNSMGRLRRFSFRRVVAIDHAQRCETINGNIVLMRMATLRKIGNLDTSFEHAMGDIDFGLRAGRKGIPCYVCAGISGTCEVNSEIGTHRDQLLSTRQRMKKILGRKELPLRSWLELTRRHGGLMWPIYFVWPYIRTLLGGVKNDLTNVMWNRRHPSSGR